jgi:hypothetical protein
MLTCRRSFATIALGISKHIHTQNAFVPVGMRCGRMHVLLGSLLVVTHTHTHTLNVDGGCLSALLLAWCPVDSCALRSASLPPSLFVTHTECFDGQQG